MYRFEGEESNGVICFVIRDIFHIETTFFPKVPYKTAWLIELGNENGCDDRIRKATERKKMMSRCLCNGYYSLKTD